MITANYFGKEDADDVDVVIVGAGLTGLSTAYNILRRKPTLNVLIIESSDKAGGRVLPRDYSEYYYASFLQNHVTQLLQSLNIDICLPLNANPRKNIFFTKHGPVDELPTCIAAEVRYFLQVIQEKTSNSRFWTYKNEERSELAMTSVDELLKKLLFFSYARSVCSSFIYSTCGMRDLRKVSALWTLLMLNGAGGLIDRLKVTMGDENRYFVQGGMTRIVEELLKFIQAENGDIIYGEPVTKIEFNDETAYCHTVRNCFKCNLVVIAVPPPEVSCISINPALPKDVSRSQMLYLQSDNIFFTVLYTAPFWSSRYSGGILSTFNSNTILNVAYDATCNERKEGVLAGFLNETNVVATSKLSLFETLNQCFRNNEAARYTCYKECTQTLDENVTVKLKSGWPMSVMPPCHISNHVRHTKIFGERILFAASEYATKWPGTIDGAIEAGELTAYLVLLKVRPQALSFSDMVTSSREIAVQESFPFEIAMMQYFCLLMHTAIFYTFFQEAYGK